jgi:menaquinone-dependent protoporphyrinogen oxidase
MKVLIAYSSGFGSTKEVSEKIAEILGQKPQFDVAVISIDDVSDIEKFDSIVIGSSVRADRPLANVRDFFVTYRRVLAEKKVALFAVCLTANCEKGRAKVKKEYLSQITEKYPELKFVSTEAFGGKIDFNRLNPVMQNLMRRVLIKTGLPTEGSVDTRDWQFIENWAHDLAEKLKS